MPKSSSLSFKYYTCNKMLQVDKSHHLRFVMPIKKIQISHKHNCERIWRVINNMTNIDILLSRKKVMCKRKTSNTLTPMNPVQRPLSFPRNRRNILNCIEQFMLLSWILDICFQKQAIHFWRYAEQKETFYQVSDNSL